MVICGESGWKTVPKLQYYDEDLKRWCYAEYKEKSQGKMLKNNPFIVPA